MLFSKKNRCDFLQRGHSSMTSRWSWVVRLLVRRIWFRAALFSLLAVALALVAAFIAPVIPYEISTKIGAEAVDNILGILASSMLAVTTFSLATMVSAFSGASSTITPRATQLLVEDSTAQNALSTFLGAFLFAIVGICALSTGIYGTSGRVILFAGTILVIAIIVFTLLRWIEHLSSFGRVGSTIARVEHVAKKAFERSPFALRTTRPILHPAGAGETIRPDRIGFITHIDLNALEAISRRENASFEVLVVPGAFVTPSRPLVHGSSSDSAVEADVRDAFRIEDHRQFDHDPRFGLVVLSEIASRALSPAVNDPGTAIAVLGAGVRTLATFLAQPDPDRAAASTICLPELQLSDLLEDLVRPIARDGAGIVEVAIKVQRSLKEIANLAPSAHDVIAQQAADALARSVEAMSFPADVEQMRRLYRECWAH